MLSRCVHQSEARRPNIIFIMTDDQTVDQMSCYGNKILNTPNMDRLANEGTRFANSFCTNSLCAPSRASILTGCYSSISGITGNSEKKGDVERLNPELPTFPELLRQAGYYTALIGKYHIRHDPKGFDEWRILPGQGSYFDPEFIENGVTTQNRGYVTDVITDKTMNFLNRIDKTQPFCLVYQHKGPHRPFTPAPRHANLWNDMEFPYPESFHDDYATRRIAKLASDMKIEVSLAGDYDDLPEGLSEEEKKKWIFQHFVKDSYRAVVGIDENLGRMLDYLDDQGLREDTLIIYTSDNGFFLGEHGWYDKRFMYEPSLRIPLVIRYPRLGVAGQVSDEMVLNVDVAPTILDIAGIPVPDVMHGRSLKPILEGNPPSGWRQSVYYAYYEDSWRMYQNLDPELLNDETYKKYFTAHRVGPHRGVRTDRYKLIEYYTEGDYFELFDLAADSHELRNLYGESGYEGITRELTKELQRLRKLYGIVDKS
ncbi:MAG: sulfatase [Candidatus Latescibacteria bacterium]|nr:sulfatase [Candidatus Latescibacterota bacterium]